MIDEAWLIITESIMRSFAFIGLYFFIGFGPGFVIGILLANRFFGKDVETYMEHHENNKQRAAQHNAQWDPSHERWREED